MKQIVVRIRPNDGLIIRVEQRFFFNLKKAVSKIADKLAKEYPKDEFFNYLEVDVISKSALSDESSAIKARRLLFNDFPYDKGLLGDRGIKFLYPSYCGF